MIEAIDFMLSGNAGNVAASLAKLGIPVELAGHSGADIIGAQFRAQLADLGVGIDKLLPHPSAGTGTSVITLLPGGERSILFTNGANSLFDLDAAPDTWLQEKHVISVGSIFVLPQFTGEAVGRLFRRARACGAATVLNICWDAREQGLSFLRPALSETDYFVLSYPESCQLTGLTQPVAILDALAEHTSGQVVLTLGNDGCCLHIDNDLSTIPAQPVQAIDATGAGDAFLAGFIAGLVEGYSAYDSARLGCRVAAYAVTGPGAYPRIPPFAKIDTL
jgi:sugar/nucleoside kinase (ribokinase family)